MKLIYFNFNFSFKAYCKECMIRTREERVKHCIEIEEE